MAHKVERERDNREKAIDRTNMRNKREKEEERLARYRLADHLLLYIVLCVPKYLDKMDRKKVKTQHY